MGWTKLLTRELPFHTWENWRYVYFVGFKKLLGSNLKNSVYFSKKNIVEAYRVEDELNLFLEHLKALCLSNPLLIRKYYSELKKLDQQVIYLTHKDVKTKKELKSYLNTITRFIKYYHTLYLIKFYSNRFPKRQRLRRQLEANPHARHCRCRGPCR